MMKRWFSYIYPLALTTGVFARLPRAWKRWRKIPQPLLQSSGPSIWIHAVSMGETRAVAPLAKLIYERIPGARLVVSSMTETGHEEAQRAMPFAAAHIFLPLDYAWIMRRWLDWCTPDLVIITETDFWFQFLRLAKERGAKLAVVNGKLSEKSARRYQQFPGISQEILGLFDLICVQSVDYMQRFLKAGVAAERLVVTGNLKFDYQTSFLTAEEKSEWRLRLRVELDEPVVVAGSTHDPEEKFILAAMREVWLERPTVKLILAPRHPERFNEVARWLASEGVMFDRWSERGSTGSTGAKVILMDAMGLLRSCYQIAEMAIVAGSFTEKVGGHNILEPADYGIPVLFGPYMHSQPELERLMLDSGAGNQVSKEQLGTVLKQLLADATERKSMGAKGMKLARENRGTTERTWKELTRCANFPAENCT